MQLITELKIELPLYSKARPRVTSRGTFMPKSYRDKQKEMVRQIKEQFHESPLEGPLRVEIEIQGEGRADGDNICGALFDAANKVLWVDDRVTIIPQIEVRWTKAPKAESRWLVRIYQV